MTEGFIYLINIETNFHGASIRCHTSEGGLEEFSDGFGAILSETKGKYRVRAFGGAERPGG